MQTKLSGLWPPVATPFNDKGDVEYSLLVRHSKALLAEGASGLAVLGTTSEANSLTMAERRRVIDAHIEAGIAPAHLLPGAGACALGDAIELTRYAGDVGAAAVLLLPPFYYKAISDDGLFEFVTRLIDGLGGYAVPILLYHIPSVAGVGWSLDLVTRLVDAFPEVIAGIKDSSGNFEHTELLIQRFPNLAIFPGAEIGLLRALSLGAAGCISASANVNARGISRLIRRWKEPDAEATQTTLNIVRTALERRGMIPSLKAVLAERYGDPLWLRVRPPLRSLSDLARAEISADSSLRDLHRAEAAIV